MRPARMLFVLPLLLTAAAFAQSPTTAPAKPSVLLVPFHMIGDGDHHAWISPAIQEDLAVDLGRHSNLRIIRPAATQPIDGLAAAREANADLVITGSYQVVEDQLRITSDVVGVHDSKSLGQFKTTGKVRDLFQLEDTLAAQLAHVLPADANAANNDSPGYTVTPVPDYYDNGNSHPRQSQSWNNSRDYTSSLYPDNYGPGYSTVSPYYQYPYAYYDSPFLYDYPFFFFSGRFHHHDRDVDHDGFDRDRLDRGQRGLEAHEFSGRGNTPEDRLGGQRGSASALPHASPSAGPQMAPQPHMAAPSAAPHGGLGGGHAGGGHR